MSPLVYAGLFPHPPLLITGVGDEQKPEVQSTDQACRELAGRIAAREPELVVIITPHGPVFSDAYTVADWTPLKGGFTAFGSPESMVWENDSAYVQALDQLAERVNLPLYAVDGRQLGKHRQSTELDHGAMIPLWYLEQAGWRGKIAVVRIGGLAPRQCWEIGRALTMATDKKLALIASGDMSHCLTDDAPSPYNPAGAKFDKLVTSALERGEFATVLAIPPDERQRAAECGWRPLITLLGSLSQWQVESQVLSYEGPFGVGYLVAGFDVRGPNGQAEFPDHTPQDRSRLTALAREAISHYLTSGEYLDAPADLAPPLDKRAGTFVSLKLDDQLRGCIGTIEPRHPNLATEIIANAVDAAVNDPRFEPVTEAELTELSISIDVLGGLTPASFADLDPKQLGLVVEWQGRRGLLLPDLPGVDTAEEQLAITCQKAGISEKHRDEAKLFTFTVTRYS